MTEALTNTLQAIHKAGCVTLADIVEGRLYIFLNLKGILLKCSFINDLLIVFYHCPNI